MKYIPLNKFPEYDENPFMENALTRDKADIQLKKRYLSKGIDQY